jgi:AcrR family transcriptional regulator
MTVKTKRKPYRSEVREAAADQTRARIVDAARTLLAGGKDLPAFSLEAVAREAGVTRLTVYNTFESKRGLLEAVFDGMARQGGLFELPSVFAEPNTEKALGRLVSVFCRFWASHGKVLPKFSAVAKLDDEIAQSLKQRSERRRQVLTALIGRIASGQEQTDLVDVLFALTSFEMFDALSVRRRSDTAVEALIQELVDDSLKRFSAGRPSGTSAYEP